MMRCQDVRKRESINQREFDVLFGDGLKKVLIKDNKYESGPVRESRAYDFLAANVLPDQEF